MLAVMKHMARDLSFHGKKGSILNDTLGNILAIAKGRCSDHKLLRILRRLLANSMAAWIKLCVRWVPSGRNVADGDSRRYEANSGSDKRLPHSTGRGSQDVEKTSRFAPLGFEGRDYSIAHLGDRLAAIPGRVSQQKFGKRLEYGVKGGFSPNDGTYADRLGPSWTEAVAGWHPGRRGE